MCNRTPPLVSFSFTKFGDGRATKLGDHSGAAPWQHPQPLKKEIFLQGQLAEAAVELTEAAVALSICFHSEPHLETIPSGTPDLANWLCSHALDQRTPLCALLNHSRGTPRAPRERPHNGSASRVQGKRTCLPIGQHSSHSRAQQGEATHLLFSRGLRVVPGTVGGQFRRGRGGLSLSTGILFRKTAKVAVLGLLEGRA